MGKTFKEPAFPVPGLQHDEDFNGMSLRDYFAAKALGGMLASEEEGAVYSAKNVAERAYEMADAMLAARA
ncbi:hypothetical protein ACW9FB_11765 [Ralstonia mannitolilytica]